MATSRKPGTMLTPQTTRPTEEKALQDSGISAREDFYIVEPATKPGQMMLIEEKATGKQTWVIPEVYALAPAYL